MCQETLARDQQEQPGKRFGTEGGDGGLLWSLGKNHNYPNDRDECVVGGTEKKNPVRFRKMYIWSLEGGN